MKPFVLPPNRLARFYEGGARIDALRGDPPGPERTPEDWVGSTATSWGHHTEGLARLDDGQILRDLVEADPEGFLGPEHVARWGANPAVLVKLLDAGERLPVHFHPGRAFAREHLDLDYGKTESWLILEAEPGAVVHVGFKEPADAGDRPPLGRDAGSRGDARRAAADRGEAGRRDPRPRRDAARDRRGHPAARAPGADRPLRAGRARGLRERRRPSTSASAGTSCCRPPTSTPGTEDAAPELPADADPYFRALRPSPGEELPPSFAVLLGTGGDGVLRTEHGDALPLTRGTTALVPFAAGTTTIEGDARGAPLPAARPGRGGPMVSSPSRSSRPATSSRPSARCRRCAARASPCTRTRSSR